MIGFSDPEVLPKHFLSQGEIFCTDKPTVISTVLGSCISVCLLDRRRGIGGMNHFVLPRSQGREQSLRYGDIAVSALINRMVKLGSRLQDLEAKLFGGATAMTAPHSPPVGDANLVVALEELEKAGIAVSAQSTGGTAGCVIHMHTGSGEVLVRRLSAAAP